MASRLDLSELAEKVTIPTLPQVVVKLNSMVENPKVGLEEIGTLVSEDAPIATKVLRIANSAVYGLAEPATSVVEAAKVIGARTIRNIALQASIFNRYDGLKSTRDLNLETIWKHAIFTGQLAQELAMQCPILDSSTADKFYTCGLLHDLGKVVMLESLGDEYLDAYRESRETGRAVHVVEEELLGYNHTDIGSIVAKRWRMHPDIVRVIQHHHGPRFEIESDPQVALVAIADQLAYRIDTPDFDVFVRKLASLASNLLKLRPSDFDLVVEWGAEVLPLIEV